MVIFNKKASPRSRTNRTAKLQDERVFSYYSNRLEPQGHRGQEQQGRGANKPTRAYRQNLKYAPSYLAFLAIAISLTNVLSLDMNPTILVPGGTTQGLLREQSVYQEEAARLLKSSFLNRSKITIDSLALKHKLQQQFPEIETVAITLPITGRKPIITFEPAQAALILSSSTKQFILNATGRVILPLNQATKAAATGLPQVLDESGLPISLGQIALPQTTENFILTVAAQLQAKQVAIQSITLPALANELHLKLADQPYIIKFNTQNDPLVAAGAFLVLKQRLEADKITPSEYIDLRVEERAYYK